MRLSVRFNDKWLVIPCGEGDKSVAWLIEETMRRSETPNLWTAQNYNAVLVESGGTLRANDPIKEVLNDSDFVHISNRESPVEHGLPEKISAKRKEHEKFVELDGCSLSTAKLVELGQGKLKIKLTEDAEKNVTKSRKLLDDIVRENKGIFELYKNQGIDTKFISFRFNHERLAQNSLLQWYMG